MSYAGFRHIAPAQAKVSKANSGRVRTQEQRDRLAEAMRQVHAQRTDEEKAAYSEKMKRSWPQWRRNRRLKVNPTTP